MNAFWLVKPAFYFLALAHISMPANYHVWPPYTAFHASVLVKTPRLCVYIYIYIYIFTFQLNPGANFTNLYNEKRYCSQMIFDELNDTWGCWLSSQVQTPAGW
jgi:hypothetical protein